MLMRTPRADKDNPPEVGCVEAHLDKLLDEALRETFPASDPIAITIDKPSKGIASDEPSSLERRMEAAPGDAMVSGAELKPPIADHDANLWGLHQILNWWSLLLWG